MKLSKEREDKHMETYEKVLLHDREMFLREDLEAVLRRTGLALVQEGRYAAVPMPDEVYLADCQTGIICRSSDPLEKVDVHTQLLIMHYLIYSRETARISGRELPFREIKGVGHFEAAFLREVEPLLKSAFAGRLDAFREAGRKLQGEPAAYGDASVKLHIFPNIPVTYILFEGDDEFPMNINILFDEAVTHCIHPEDVPVVGEYGAKALVRAAEIW